MAQRTRHQQIQRILIIVLVINLAVAAAKLLVGALTGSLAMLADGFHSTLDATSNIIGLIGIAIASRPPDSEHPYGHRRFETLASMMIGGMLLLTAWELVQGSIERLSSGTAPVVTALSFIAMLATLVVNIFVSTYERRAGRRLSSEILLADSEHTSSDIFVSLTVIAGLIAVRLGWIWADSIATLFVVVLIGLAAWRIIQESANVLVDRAALDAVQVRRIVGKIAGIEQVARVRSRGPGDDIYLDLGLRVAAPMTAEQTAAIADEIRARLRTQFDGLSDIQIEFYPYREGPPDFALIARAESDALGLGVHEVIAATSNRGMTLEMHVEVPPELSVAEAHTLVTQFEERMKEKLPQLERIVTHIEPAHIHEHVNTDATVSLMLAQSALAIARGLYPNNNWHDFNIRAEEDGGYALSMHCYVSEDASIEAAHRLAEQVETKVRAALPTVHRVTIHTEPHADVH